MQRFIQKNTNSNYTQKEISSLSSELSLHKIIVQILLERGFTNSDEILNFFKFDEKQIHDPFLLHDMQKAVETIKSHIDKKHKIAIYGDYDVDGVMSTTILVLFFRSMDVEVVYKLPNRYTDGYGLNTSAIDQLIADGVDLIITVDCGITSIAEADYIAKKNIDLIITDHHQPKIDLPRCCGVINPLLGDYPFKKLCGAGVAGKLIHALSDYKTFCLYLDLIAIATVSDLVPLVDENRVFVKYGIDKINKDMPDSILALKNVAGIKNKLDAGHIAFALGPRINAAGRIDTANIAIDLFLSDNLIKAKFAATMLNQFNIQRQEEQQRIFNTACEIIDSTIDLKEYRIIVIGDPTFNKGIVGIVASKLVEKYNRPCLLFCTEGEFSTGSGRSIPGVHLFNLLNEFNDSYEKFGGHEQAVGLTIKTANMATIANKLNKSLTANYPGNLFVPSGLYDCKINLSDISLDLINQIQSLAPMGMSNPTPVFLLENVQIQNAKTMGSENSHLRFSVVSYKDCFEGVGFSMGDRLNDINPNAKYDMLVTLNINEWQGNITPQILVKHFKPNVQDNVISIINNQSQEYFNCICDCNYDYKSEKKLPRLRRMWRGDVYISRRLKKDVYGTVILTSIPSCTKELLYNLKNQNLCDHFDITTNAPSIYNSIVIAPDWSIDKFSHKRIVINDFAPFEYIKRVIEKNHNIQVVLCNDSVRDMMIDEFILSTNISREQLLSVFSYTKQLFNKNSNYTHAQLINNIAEKFGFSLVICEIITTIFIQLNLLTINNDIFTLNKNAGKKELTSSETYKTLKQLGTKLTDNIQALVEACK